jgi:hypothetical protein
MAILYWMKKYNIPRRTDSESTMGEKNGFYGKKHSKETRKINSLKHKGSNHNQWKGGIKINNEGYVLVYIDDDSPYFVMREQQNYIREHRYVMAKHLGRLLNDDEVVHHINGDKTDNRIENLQIMTAEEHTILHTLQRKGVVCLHVD